MKNMKAVFLDIDGTLISDKHLILKSTIDAVDKLKRLNILVCLITARPPQATINFYNELKILDNPMICFNGAYITYNNNVILDLRILKDTTEALITKLKPLDLSINYYSGSDWYVNKIDENVKNEMAITGVEPIVADINLLLQQSILPNKILCNGNPELLDKCKIELKDKFAHDLSIYKSKPNYLEITRIDSSKASAIIKILDLCQIKTSEILVFGDNFNDLDMFEIAGTSVAMGNSPDGVKTKATFVTDTNNNDGIAKFLFKIL